MNSSRTVSCLCFLLLLLQAMTLGCSAETSAPSQVTPAPQTPGPSTDSGSQAQNRDRGPRYRGLSVTDKDLQAIKAACAESPIQEKRPGYSGPVVDAHMHTSLDNNQGAFALALLNEMNQQGVSRVLIQPDHSPDLTAHQGLLKVYRELEATWGRIGAVCDRIVPLIYAFDPADPGSWSYVEERLATGSYGGVGEIEFLHTRMGIEKPVHSPTMDRIYKALEERRGIFHLQADVGKDPALAQQVNELIQNHPGIRFVWFGSDQCFEAPNPGNLICTVFPTRSESLLTSLSPEQRKRVVMGTDHSPKGFNSSSAGHLPYDSFGEGVEALRTALHPLPAEAAADIGHANFDRLLQ